MASTATRWANWVRRGRPGSMAAASLSPVTFPDQPLRPRARLALGADLSASPATWSWTDITQYVRWQDGITSTDGRGDNSSLVTPGSTDMTLTNDGRFSRRNPFGPYYGLITPNTPIWIELDAGAGMYTVAEHFVNEWPTRWAPGALDCVTPIKCAGVLRRLQKGDLLDPPMERAIRASGPIAAWSLDDGTTSTTAGSLTGGSAMSAVGTVDFATVAGPVGGAALLADLTTGTLSGSVPSSSGTSWAVEFLLQSFDDSIDGFLITLTTTTGVVGMWPDFSGAPRGMYFSSIAGGNNSIYAAAVDPEYLDTWHHVVIKVTDSVAGIDSELWWDGELAASGDPGVLSAPGVPTRLDLNPLQGAGVRFEAAYGYAAVYGDATLVDAEQHYQAMLAWVGDQAHERIIRECGFSGVPIVCAAGSSTVLGAQPAGTLLDVLRDAERADMGVLYEVGWGLGYQPLRDRFDAPVAMALDFDEGHVDGEPEPADDDSQLVNRWKVSRDGGSFSTQEDDFSPLGTQAGGPGVFPDAITVNVETDIQLPHQARWRIHRDTLDEDRWPKIDLNFATLGGRTLIPVWTTLGYGARITLDSPPPEVSQAQINLIIEGRRQHFNSLEWTASINASPASTYQVARYAPSAVPSRYDTRGSSLAIAVDDSDTDWLVTIQPGYPRWVTSLGYPDRFAPSADLKLSTGGLIRSCTSISSVILDPFSRTVADDWSGDGFLWTMSGGSATDYSASGGKGLVSQGTVNVQRFGLIEIGHSDADASADIVFPVVPTGAAISGQVLLRATNTSNYYAASLSIATTGIVTLLLGGRAGGSLIGGLPSSVIGTHSAGDRWKIWFSVHGSSLRAKAALFADGDPGEWQIEATNTTLTTGTKGGVNQRLESGNTNPLPVVHTWDNFEVTNPQLFVMERLTPDKTVPAGTSVRVYQPPIYGI